MNVTIEVGPNLAVTLALFAVALTIYGTRRR